MCFPMRAGTEALVNTENGAESSEKFGKFDAKLGWARNRLLAQKTKWMLHFYFLSTKVENAFQAQVPLIN